MCPTALEQKFESININDLGQRSYYDLDLFYSYSLPDSLSQLFVLTLSSQFASTVSVTSSVQAFEKKKKKKNVVRKLHLAVKNVKVT